MTTSIEWTNATWNPVRGCTKISPGCKNCYAETFAERFRGVAGHPYEQGFDLRLVPQSIEIPLKRKQPTKYFVNSMSDLFHEGVPDEFIEKVFAVMALTQHHTFQILTKRPERMKRWFAENNGPMETCEQGVQRHSEFLGKIRWDDRGNQPHLYHRATAESVSNRRVWPGWPLPNVWPGVSVENQKAANERIPLLQETPAAVRFLSVEPMLEAVDLDRGGFSLIERVKSPEGKIYPGVDWVICGGESGPGARTFNLAWAESLLKQCRAAGVPFFMKQIGSRPVGPAHLIPHISKDRKGGDPAEWPEQLRVREWPKSA